jgi:hypothetical protein
MHATHTAAGVVSLALFVSCSQSTSPSGPTSGPARAPSTTTAADNPTGTGLAPDVVVGAATKGVPFKGRLEGTYTFAPDPPPSPFASVHLEATGNATHLGRFTLDAPHRVNVANLPVTATGIFEFTAANGDKVTADFTGLGTPTESPGVFAIVETATITGGTGRFVGATGSFIVRRMVDLASPVATGSFEGTISSAAIGRP